MARDLSRPRETLERRTGHDFVGRTVAEFLVAWIRWRPREDVLERIARGRVELNGAVAHGGELLRLGDHLLLRVDPPPEWKVDLDAIPISILHEEEAFVVLDKAAGVVVHPVGKFVSDTLMNVLFARYRGPDGAPTATPMVVHRLDRQTSGVLVVAKNDEARRRLGLAFEERRVEKEYLALVRGAFGPERTIVEAPIGPDPRGINRTMMAVREDGKSAQTEFELVRRFRGASLVRCRPLTGRTHQLRLHLAHLGHPIWCDPLYGPDGDPGDPGRIPPMTAAAALVAGEGLDPDVPILNRLGLHAAALSFAHPFTNAPLRYEAPVPADLAAALAVLERACDAPG
jgi:23S rRNA pseudouridine1911/1915/1917 synthase